MNHRTAVVLLHRSQALGQISSDISTTEHFQNETLRPILKFQNELLIAVFKAYIIKQKINFDTFSIPKKEQFIENLIQKDIGLRNTLKGIIIGLFTIEEFEKYADNKSEFNKRITNLIVERIKSQLQII